MKIRIKGDSIRFRLTQTEVKALSKNGKIYDSTNFANQKFNYGVVLNKTINHLGIRFENNTIILEMPELNGKSWYKNDIITFDHTFKTSNENELFLLLEKDFTCLDNTSEDQSDNYPNPKLS
ncbi:hypothetical protein [uncultured Maribacter sp.]|uniref:DUF7009 family protein n=1 Tax=uncultured Maribacter sp. TaxID=431308 RepID=UPI0030EB76C3|tara:strand:- start:23213 stop:23578 length:366 start_codon:yes stop_codon:yes gene_type:complete